MMRCGIRMDNDVTVNVENISKKYCKSLKKSMYYGVKDIGRNMFGLSSHSECLRKSEFWAVDNVSFELKKGETLGFLGPNGSGKTTILKMLNGIFWPDKGKITEKGRVGALIEVGAGFHPLLTGRENIYINAAILGMTKKQVDEKFDDIVEFADIGDFIDVPVKSYSSGMFVRLGFAVAVHCEPEILLIDEVLAVGDRDFQIKCFRKIHELKKNEDMSMVLVSHNEYAMREYAQNCLVLDHGKPLFYGESEDAISYYVNKVVKEREVAVDYERNVDRGIIKSLVLRNGTNEIVDRVLTGDKIVIDFEYATDKKIRNPIFGISFYNGNGLFAGFWNSYEKVRLPDIDGKGIVRVTVDRFDFPVDNYRIAVVVCEDEESNVVEWKDVEQKLTVERPNDTRGFLKLPNKWEVIS
jgi:ABC-type polysaccharide/polyol phosphate transport system ATPase subunit